MFTNGDDHPAGPLVEPLRILYEDEHLVAVDKPNNLFVHRTHLDRTQRDSAVQRLRAQLDPSVTLVHRLDRPTSGVLLFARHPDAARLMNHQFSEREVHKSYTALVRGYVSEEGSLDYPLKHKTRQITQSARTRWRLIQTGELAVATPPHPTSRFSLVRLFPETGRWHQLRRHFAHLRHPIIGDTSHGDTHQNRILTGMLSHSRLYLHASELRFRHPFDPAVTCTIRSMPPPSFTAIAPLFGWSDSVFK